LRKRQILGVGEDRLRAARWIEQPVDEGRFLALDTGTISVLGYEHETPVVRRWNS